MGSKYDEKVSAQMHFEWCELKIYLRSLADGEMVGREINLWMDVWQCGDEELDLGIVEIPMKISGRLQRL
jgi:hypothetical protein